MRVHADAGSSRHVFRVGQILLVPVWIVALGYLGLVVLRFVAFDATTALAVLNAQTVWVFLPVYAVASAAWCFRRFALAGTATISVVFHAVVVVASIGVVQAVPAAARAGPHLRVLTANVRYTNPTPERLAQELLAADADIVLLQEVTPRWIEVLGAAGFASRYPYSARRIQLDAGGQAVFSRLPLERVQVTVQAYWPTIQASVDFHGTRITFVDVHAKGPPQGMRRHDASVDRLIDLTRSLPEPRVVAGDFNASPYNRTVHRIMDLGLDSAHERRGRGLAATWPNGKQPFTPIQLDHVFVDDTIAVLDIRELRRYGIGPQARRDRPRARVKAFRRARRRSRPTPRSTRTRARRAASNRGRGSRGTAARHTTRRGRAARGRSRARSGPS